MLVAIIQMRVLAFWTPQTQTMMFSPTEFIVLNHRVAYFLCVAAIKKPGTFNQCTYHSNTQGLHVLTPSIVLLSPFLFLIFRTIARR